MFGTEQDDAAAFEHRVQPILKELGDRGKVQCQVGVTTVAPASGRVAHNSTTGAALLAPTSHPAVAPTRSLAPSPRSAIESTPEGIASSADITMPSVASSLMGEAPKGTQYLSESFLLAERERMDRQVERERAARQAEREWADRQATERREEARQVERERADRQASERQEARIIVALSVGACTCGVGAAILGAALMLAHSPASA